jgi:hypothetical protein
MALVVLVNNQTQIIAFTFQRELTKVLHRLRR